MTEFKITTSDKTILNYTKSLIYHNGRMLDLTGTDYLGKNGKIKVGWYYVYLLNNINSQLFKDEFNKLNYTPTDKKIETVITFINNSNIVKICLNQINQNMNQLNQIPQLNQNQIPQLNQNMNQLNQNQIPQMNQLNQLNQNQIQIPELLQPSSQQITINSPSKQSPKQNKRQSPKQSPKKNIYSNINSITIRCSSGEYTFNIPIDKNILNEIISNIQTI